MNEKEKNELLKQIPSQLNLLAFNMSLEAGRLNRNGRGLAVVADEMQNLALQSMEAIENNDKETLSDIVSMINLLTQNSILEISYMSASIGEESNAALIIAHEFYTTAEFLKQLLDDSKTDIVSSRKMYFKNIIESEYTLKKAKSSGPQNNYVITTVGDFLVGFKVIKFVNEILYAIKTSKHIKEFPIAGNIVDVESKVDYIRAILNLRGQNLLVIDLQKRLGLGETNWNGDKESRILISKMGDRYNAILVKKVHNIISIPNELWKEEKEFQGINPLFLKKSCELKAGRLYRLNMNSVIDTVEIEKIMNNI